ncbi:hypothetical protein, partial [Phytohabitans kaempferiae]
MADIDEDIQAALDAVAQARADHSDVALLGALHILAARLSQAGRSSESAGLGLEAAGVLAATAVTGDPLQGMASNAVYIGAYISPGDEAIAVTSTAVNVFRGLHV